MGTGGVARPTGHTHPLLRPISREFDRPPHAYSVVEDEDYAFVLTAWRVNDGVVRTKRFACRLADRTIAQIGVRNTHHVDDSIDTAAWVDQFLEDREQRALEVARNIVDGKDRLPRKPFDGAL